ncbi:MAG: recombinase family protein [Sphingomonadaceae bacterium]|nr:recombinase family protein [Sphingomonadaceae bacterium]
MTASTIPLRAALYLRVSTARQAEHDVSIPDQKRQGEAYCASRGYQLVETYVEPVASATNDRHPEFQLDAVLRQFADVVDQILPRIPLAPDVASVTK